MVGLTALSGDCHRRDRAIIVQGANPRTRGVGVSDENFGTIMAERLQRRRAAKDVDAAGSELEGMVQVSAQHDADVREPGHRSHQLVTAIELEPWMC